MNYELGIMKGEKLRIMNYELGIMREEKYAGI